uniref:Uncharacterized protein n=1 Tax=Brassica oleracea TaxID=3712 RepID=A0A3P6HCF3_BRAOL|nr:unnamed protein product [Brassica oleracea]
MWQLEKELKKYFELIVEKSSWDPEINSKIGYLPKLWNIHGQLVKRTGVAVDPSSGQIDMIETWWSDRIAEYGGTKGRLVHVLQKKPLPFKDLSDQIFGEHDVDQDERYSPHMLGLQLQQVQPTLDVDGITMVDQMQETQTAEQIVDLTSDQGCNRSIRSMSSRRLPRRKTSFDNTGGEWISACRRYSARIFRRTTIKKNSKDNIW